MERSPFEDVVHRVNNLLATIDIQVEVARGDGSAAALADALRLIQDSARRTRVELQRLMARDGPAGRAPAAEA